MRRNFVPLALAAWLAATVAGAQLSQTYTEWSAGPAGFLLTDSERKAYAQIKTDAEAQAFIDLFWARRDPDLNTVQDEFKLDFEMKVAAADKQFSTDRIKGSMSDRGKVLILMGVPPTPVINVPPGTEEEEGNRPGFLQRGATQVWTYTKDGKPAAKKKDEILFVFTETSEGAGDFVLDRADRRNLQAMKLLAGKPEQLILNPKLTEVPRVGLLPGSKAASTAQQTVFDLQPRPWPEGARVLTASGVQSETIHPAWVWAAADAVPPATEAVGRVRATRRERRRQLRLARAPDQRSRGPCVRVRPAGGRRHLEGGRCPAQRHRARGGHDPRCEERAPAGRGAVHLADLLGPGHPAGRAGSPRRRVSPRWDAADPQGGQPLQGH
jgi:GWxTD domain-containing protein